MKLKLLRYSENKESTLGLLFVDNKFQCYTIEDICRKVKIKHTTRIPSGIYEIKLRTIGGFHKKYSIEFWRIHVGMLELQNVPGFENILIHIGNESGDTSGCILVGNKANNNQLNKGFISNSKDAYVNIYKKVSKALLAGGKVTIEIIDNE